MARRVSVTVDADVDPFNGKMGQAAGSALTLKAILDSIGDERILVDVDVRGDQVAGLRDGIGEVNELTGQRRVLDVDTRQADSSINQLTGRLRLFADAAAIFGPGLIPIGALAVPAVAGVASQLGIAAAAAGVAVLAFQGVGDAATAMNDYAFDPTVANAEKVQQALAKLSPQARQFATEIADMRDTLTATRDAAAEGFFGELNPELDHLEGLLGRVQPLLEKIGGATGEMLGDGLESLDSDRWQGFFDFLQAEARPTLLELGQTAGDFTHGLAEMWMAFQPLNRDFGSWLRDVASGFDDWAAGLDQTEGFNDFMAYLRDSGPQVADTLGALGSALLDIAIAAAPLGGPVLAGVEAFANVVSTIADSDLGTPILTAVAALALLNRTMAVTGRLAQTAGLTGGGRGAAAGSAAGGLFAGTRANVAQAKQYGAAIRGVATEGTRANGILRDLGTVVNRAGQSSRFASERTLEARRNIGQYAGAAGKAAAGAAALAVAFTDTDNSLGLQNTAMLGLAGTMLGPLGAAAGASVGFFLDYKSAVDDGEAATRQLQAALDGTDFGVLTTGLQSAETSLDSLRSRQETFDLSGKTKALAANLLGPIGLAVAQTSDRFGQLFGDAADGVESTVDPAERAAAAFRQLAIESIGPGESIADLDQVMQRISPTLQQMGYDFDSLSNMSYPQVQQLADDVRAFVTQTDSAPGRLDAFETSLSGLGNEMLTNADSAAAMGAALQALLSPTLDAEEATHAWRASLDGLKTQLNDQAGFGGATEASRANAAATRDVVRATQDMLVKRAQAGATEKQIARAVADSRAEFIANGMAAGFSRKEITRRADALGLTPKLVETTFRVAGIGAAERQARALRENFQALPKRLQTEVRANGIPRTSGEIEALRRKYNLTPKQVQTLVNLRDEAALRGINSVQRLLKVLGGTTAKPTITINNAAAMGAIAGVKSGMAGIQSKTVTITINEVVNRARQAAGGGVPQAFGGMWFGGVQTFANGGSLDRANHHMPEFAGPGPARIWREEETLGETYIPHANDYRRPRAKSILERTAGLFGGEVFWYANGGLSGSMSGGGGRGGATSGGAFGDWQRERRAAAAERKQQHRELLRMLQARTPGDQSAKELKKLADQYRRFLDAQRERRQERMQDLRDQRGAAGAFGSVEVDNDAESLADALKQFERDITRSGGKWTGALDQQGEALLAVSARYQTAADELDAANQALADLEQESREYHRTVAQSINNGIFGNGLAGAGLQLEADTNDLAALLAAFEAADAAGLEGEAAKALYASGDLNTAQQLAAGGTAAVEQFEKQIEARLAIQESLGRFASQEVYAGQITAAAATQATAAAMADQIAAEFRDGVAAMQTAVRDATRTGTREGTREGALEGVMEGWRGRDRITSTLVSTGIGRRR